MGDAVGFYDIFIRVDAVMQSSAGLQCRSLGIAREGLYQIFSSKRVFRDSFASYFKNLDFNEVRDRWDASWRTDRKTGMDMEGDKSRLG